MCAAAAEDHLDLSVPGSLLPQIGETARRGLMRIRQLSGGEHTRAELLAAPALRRPGVLICGVQDLAGPARGYGELVYMGLNFAGLRGAQARSPQQSFAGWEVPGWETLVLAGIARLEQTEAQGVMDDPCALQQVVAMAREATTGTSGLLGWLEETWGGASRFGLDAAEEAFNLARAAELGWSQVRPRTAPDDPTLPNQPLARRIGAWILWDTLGHLHQGLPFPGEACVLQADRSEPSSMIRSPESVLIRSLEQELAQHAEMITRLLARQLPPGMHRSGLQMQMRRLAADDVVGSQELAGSLAELSLELSRSTDAGPTQFRIWHSQLPGEVRGCCSQVLHGRMRHPQLAGKEDAHAVRVETKLATLQVSPDGAEGKGWACGSSSLTRTGRAGEPSNGMTPSDRITQ